MVEEIFPGPGNMYGGLKPRDSEKGWGGAQKHLFGGKLVVVFSVGIKFPLDVSVRGKGGCLSRK